MKVYCIQPDIAWHDAAANRERLGRMIVEAAPAAGSLVVLPEMFASGFTGDVSAATDSPNDESAAWCAALAAQFGCTIVAGLVTTADDGRGRNQAAVFGPGGEMGRYTKIHPFSHGGEARQYAPGDRIRVFQLDDTGGMDGEGAIPVRVAPLVCYDLRFPETFRQAAVEGVDVFVVIASWPSAREHHWHALLRARAIENQAFVVGVNRTGSDPHVAYSGGTRVFDYDGHPLVSMDELPAVSSTTLDLEALRQYRRKLPFLSDLRTQDIPRPTPALEDAEPDVAGPALATA